ncbi:MULTISPECIES: hypothetical protein [unclassified Bacillus (in: firmicutes)]|uniref:hypothetical protein n=1 Tax=unclassified Bacillus (in: firmicutes) TaxID=185979 RepID=UPI000BF22D94|nr:MULTISPECIES: hypothetical protein [unclassified Bacillus (in: firmicutes)]PEJ48683.1 hypothetical protein CN692_23480 [Bacillus sp. AFS002410]PEL13983.1 hypothetical protein CN601_02745 [Bacillus sp. AFS017336]
MKRIKAIGLLLCACFLLLTGCGKEEKSFKRKPYTPVHYTEKEKETYEAIVLQLAKEYIEKTHGPITPNQRFEATVEEDGTFTVQVYKDLGDSNEGIAWLNVNPKTKKIIEGVH